MSVKIRLQRHGATHKPFYHIVAADIRSPRDGRYIEKLGYYDPNKEPSVIELKEDKIKDWYKKGAAVSEAVMKMLTKRKVVLSRKDN